MPPEPTSRAGLQRRLVGSMLIAAGIFVFDQLTKLVVRTHLGFHDSIPLVDGFVNIVHARNPGAAFSFLANAPAWFRGPFFIAITLIAVVVVFSVIRRLPAEDRLMRFALSAVLGGALGNLCDRLRYGEVIDFIDVYWRGHHWPAFNVADSSITLAVVTVVLHTLFVSSAESRKADSKSPRLDS
jgi:signal peptidase II